MTAETQAVFNPKYRDSQNTILFSPNTNEAVNLRLPKVGNQTSSDDLNCLESILSRFTLKNEEQEWLRNGGIDLILKHTDLVDLCLVYHISFSELITEIKEEENVEKLTTFYGAENSRDLVKKIKTDQDIEYLMKIWGVLGDYQYAFTTWIVRQEPINTYQLENIFLVFSFFYDRQIKSFNNITKAFKIAFSLPQNSNKIVTIKENFNLTEKINSKEDFIGTILRFLKRGNEEEINQYLERKNISGVKINNDPDLFISEILKGNDNDKKKNLGEKLEKIVNRIIERLLASQTSSTEKAKSGYATGNTTNFFKRVERKLKNHNEPRLEYFNRVAIFNWKQTIDPSGTFVVNKSGNKKFNAFFEACDDKNRYFFESLKYGKEILQRYEKVISGGNKNINIKVLIDLYNNLLEQEEKNFKKTIQAKNN